MYTYKNPLDGIHKDLTPFYMSSMIFLIFLCVYKSTIKLKTTTNLYLTLL